MANNTEKRITAKMVLDSTGFNEGLKGVNSELRLSQSELKNANAGIQAFGKDSERLKSVQEALAKQIELQAKKVDIYKESMEKSTAKMQENIQARDELKSKLDQEKNKYDEVIKLYGKESEEASKAKESLDKLTEEYKKKEKAVESSAKQIQNYTININKAEAALKKTQGELSKVNEELEESKDEWLDSSESISKFEEVGNKVSVGVTAIAGAVAGVSVAAIKMGDDLKRSLNGIQSSLGLTNDDMDNMKQILLDIYNDNFGEGFEDIGEAIKIVGQQTGATGDELKSLTEDAFALRDTFGFEVNESVRAANTLIKQFGITGHEAYNLIAQGAQQGLNFSDELLDSINEYSVQFKKSGMEAEDMFNILLSGTQDGAFNLDKIGDAVKEFNIRIIDGSKTTEDGLKQLGLNADIVAKNMVAGGEKSQKQYYEIVEALGKIDDKQKQNIVGTELFGTMWEDLGPKVISSLQNTNDAFNRTNDTMKKLNEVRFDTMGEAFEGIKRQLTTGVLIPISEKLLPKLSEFSQWFTSNMPEIKEKVGEVMDEVIPIFEGFGEALIFVKDNANILIPAVGTLAVGIGALKTITTVNTLLTTLGITSKGAASTVGIVGKAAEVAAGVGGVGGLAGLGTSLGGLAIAAAPWLAAGAAVAGIGYAIYKGMTEEATPAVDLFANKVTQTAVEVTGASGTMSYGIQEDTIKISEATKQAVGAYMELDNSAKQSLTDLYVNGTEITDQTVTTLVGKYNEMGAQIKTGMDKHYTDELNTMQTFFQNSKALSDAEEANALASLKKNNDSKKAETDNYTKQIQDILKKASDEKRSLTLEEQQKVNSIQETMRTNAVKSLSSQEIESKVILERLKEYGTRITAEQASEVIKNANKQRDESVKSANDQYSKTVAEIIRMRDETHSITSEQADKLIASAQRQRDESITKAEELRNGVVGKIKSMNGDIESNVSTTTGNILTYWDKLKNWWDNWNPGSKTFTIMENKVSASSINARWTGDDNYIGGYTTLHERGYELYDLPRSTRIYNHDASEDLVLKTAESVATKVAQSVLGNFNGGNEVNVIQNIYSTVPSPSEIARQTKNNLRELSLHW